MKTMSHVSKAVGAVVHQLTLFFLIVAKVITSQKIQLLVSFC